MRANIKYESKFWMQNLVLSAVVSFIAIFCIPNIVNWSIGKPVTEVDVSIKLFALGEVIAVGILCWMGLSRNKKASIFKVFGRVFCTGIILFLAMIVVSALCGILSTLLYVFLKNIFNFGQIKGILNFLITVIVFLSIPFMESVFWKEISMSQKFMASLKTGIAIKGEKYRKLLSILLLMFGAGYLVTIVFNFVPVNLWTNIVKVVVFTLLGTIGLGCSEQAVR